MVLIVYEILFPLYKQTCLITCNIIFKSTIILNMNIFRATLLFLLLYITSFLHADEYSINPPSSWIEKIEIPENQQNRKDSINGEYYLLSDMQIQTAPREFFNHYAVLISNSTGLENNSQISIDFDPTFQQLIIHEIQIIRNKKIINKLGTSIISVIQKENELEKLLYNGTKSFYAILSDIRIKDILEISYTIKEEKPLFMEYSNRFYTEWTFPVQKIYRRIISSPDKKIYFASNGGIEKPVSKNNGEELIWEIYNSEAIDYDENTPYWYDPYSSIEISQFTNWSQVSKKVSNFYKPLTLSDAQSDYIYSQYPGISKSTSSEKIVEIMLNAIQEEIRYLGIEIGEGSFVPTDPDIVYKRRFGDCKDKSLLLCELLKYKGINAVPVLVHSTSGKNLVNVLPSPYWFNHVIVKIIINNKTYWFDPTLTFQEGSIDRISEASYGYGLVISDQYMELEKIQPSFSGDNIIINEVFTLPDDPVDDGLYKIETIYHDKDADYIRSLLSNTPYKTVRERFLIYIGNYYPGLKIAEDFTFSDNKRENILTLHENYRIPNIWILSQEDKISQFLYSPFEISSYISEINYLERSMPYNLGHPIKIRQNVKINLPEKWNIEPSSNRINSEIFQYSKNIGYKDQELSLSYTYQSLKDSVSIDKITLYNENLKSIFNEINHVIYWTHDKKAGSLFNVVNKISGILLSSFAVIYLILRLLRKRKNNIKKNEFIDRE